MASSPGILLLAMVHRIPASSPIVMDAGHSLFLELTATGFLLPLFLSCRLRYRFSGRVLVAPGVNGFGYSFSPRCCAGFRGRLWRVNNLLPMPRRIA